MTSPDYTVVSVPVSSFIYSDPNVRRAYIEKAIDTPTNVRILLFSPRTGAFLRGVVKTADLPPQSVQFLAQVVLKVAIGELAASELASEISRNLNTPQTIAEKVSKDIEKDLLSSISLELNSHHPNPDNHKQKTQSTPPTKQNNVLDLKQPQKPLRPPEIPPN